MTKETHQNGMEHAHNIPVFAIAEGVLGLLKGQSIRSGLQSTELVVSYSELLNPGDVLGGLTLGLSKMAIPRSPTPLDPNADHAVLASAVANDDATGTQVRVDVVQGPYSSQRRIIVFAQRFGESPVPTTIASSSIGDAIGPVDLIPPGTIEHPGAAK